jgi:hypothetical protein
MKQRSEGEQSRAHQGVLAKLGAAAVTRSSTGHVSVGCDRPRWHGVALSNEEAHCQTRCLDPWCQRPVGARLGQLPCVISAYRELCRAHSTSTLPKGKRPAGRFGAAKP